MTPYPRSPNRTILHPCAHYSNQTAWKFGRGGNIRLQDNKTVTTVAFSSLPGSYIWPKAGQEVRGAIRVAPDSWNTSRMIPLPNVICPTTGETGAFTHSKPGTPTLDTNTSASASKHSDGDGREREPPKQFSTPWGPTEAMCDFSTSAISQ